MAYLGVFELKFGKTIAITEISNLQFLKIEFLTRTLNFGIGSAFSKCQVQVQVRFIKYAACMYGIIFGISIYNWTQNCIF